MFTARSLKLSAALAARFSPAERRAWLDRLVPGARSLELSAAEVAAGLELWRRWAADANMTLGELAAGLAPLIGSGAAHATRALAGELVSSK